MTISFYYNLQLNCGKISDAVMSIHLFDVTKQIVVCTDLNFHYGHCWNNLLLDI